jgi:hypothetical protein
MTLAQATRGALSCGFVCALLLGFSFGDGLAVCSVDGRTKDPRSSRVILFPCFSSACYNSITPTNLDKLSWKRSSKPWLQSFCAFPWFCAF